MTDESPEARLTERIAALERKNRHLSQSIFVLSLGFLALICIAATPSEPKDVKFATVEAQQIIVRNASGHQLIIKGYDGLAEGVAIDLLKNDARGKQVVLARLADFDNQGQFSINALDNGRQIMFDVGGIGSAVLGAVGKGPGIFIRGEGPYVALRDSGNRVALIGSAQLVGRDGSEIVRPASSITLLNGNQVVWSAPQP